MAGARHPVCVSGAALVQTERFQVGACGTPASPRGGGGSSWPSASKMPLTFPRQMFAFSVCWSDDSDSFVRRSWEDFRRLHVSKPGHNFPQQPDAPETTPSLPLCPLGLSAKGPLPAVPGEPSEPSETDDASSHSQKTLKETFPVEAGLLRRSDRVLPKLPGQARSDPRRVGAAAVGCEGPCGAPTDAPSYSQPTHPGWCTEAAPAEAWPACSCWRPT